MPSIDSSSPASGAPKSSLRILYADDVRELQDVARIAFTRDGHAIECVDDGALALSRLTDDPEFDLVITDHHMPRMNGLELVKNLRARDFRGKIMVFSSELSEAVAQEYRQKHVDQILYKPVFPSVLRKSIAELFPLPAATRPASFPVVSA
jgi:two-component system, chemotaxis family, chemotaxis protein CheY